MSFSYGEALRITIFGQSHAETVGVVIDGLPAGEKPDMQRIAAFMARRAPGGELTSPRKEADAPRIVSGLANGCTCGAPLTALIENTDTRSGDYASLADVPRPSHADYAAAVKYGGYHDIRGGGYFSARLTAPLCFAGAVAKDILSRRGIELGAHLQSVGNAEDEGFDPVNVCAEDFTRVLSHELPVLREKSAREMAREIEMAREAGDSVGGVIECAVTGLPGGLGSPIFGGVENRISSIIFAIPAVRGIEFGAGFAASRMRGSEHNDAFCMDGIDVKTRTNRHGGVLGGLTSGMPLIFRTAFKPTPSIALEQDSVSLSRGENVKLSVKGRHDPCVALRAVPCVETAAALAILDMLLQEGR